MQIPYNASARPYNKTNILQTLKNRYSEQSGPKNTIRNVQKTERKRKQIWRRGTKIRNKRLQKHEYP